MTLPFPIAVNGKTERAVGIMYDGLLIDSEWNERIWTDAGRISWLVGWLGRGQQSVNASNGEKGDEEEEELR